MASDSAIDAALAELHAQDSPSRSNNKSKGNNHNHNNKGNYNYGTLNPSDNTNNGGGASGGNRSRSVSVSTRASGFSADELVRPALNYASESDPLLAIPPPERIKPNRSRWRRVFHVHHYPRSAVLPLTCLSIALNTLTANGPMVWPLYGPIVIRSLSLSTTQGQTIVLGGILGTYLMAAPLGRFSDRRGPRATSMLSALLAFIGYQSFSLLLTHPTSFTPTTLTLSSHSTLTPQISINLEPLPLLLCLSFSFLGMSAIGAYFSALTTASLNFPRYPTLALSLPLSCFGLSSLALSSFGRWRVFWSPVLGKEKLLEGVAGLMVKERMELDPIQLTRFFGFLVPGINLFSAIWLFILPSSIEEYPNDPTIFSDGMLSDVAEENEEDSNGRGGAGGLGREEEFLADEDLEYAEGEGEMPSNMSASLHAELENHSKRRMPYMTKLNAATPLSPNAFSPERPHHGLSTSHHGGSYIRSASAATHGGGGGHRPESMASSKILDVTEHTPLLIGGPEALYAAVLEDQKSLYGAGVNGRRSRSVSLSKSQSQSRTPRKRRNLDLPAVEVSGEGEGENTRLLNGGGGGAGGEEGDKEDWEEVRDVTFRSLAVDRSLWALGGVMLLAIGPGEMTISGIGYTLNSLLGDTISSESVMMMTSAMRGHLASLDPFSIGLQATSSPSSPFSTTSITDEDALHLRSYHVLLISIASTVARLTMGILADYLAPRPPPPGVIAPLNSRRMTVRRSVLAAGCSFVMSGVFVFGAVGLREERWLAVVSLGIGAMYGAFFTVTPAITSKHFGPANFGLAWGMVSYFCAVGAIIFSYLYAFISEYMAAKQRHPAANGEEDLPLKQCYGPECFQATFWIAAISCAMSGVGMVWLGKRWGS